MRERMRLILGTVLLTASMLTSAAALDVSAPLLCAVTNTVSCDSRGDCVEGPAETVNLPVFLKVDVQNKTAQSLRVGGEQRTSEILSIHQEEGSLVLLGFDQNHGWSLAIAMSSGKLTLTVAGEGIGYMAFGACTPQ